MILLTLVHSYPEGSVVLSHGFVTPDTILLAR